MAIEVKHQFVSEIPDGDNAEVVQPSDWNEAHTLNMGAGNLLGRITAGQGPVEEIPIDTFALAEVASLKVTKSDDTGLGGFSANGKSLGNLSGSLTPTHVGGNYMAGTITGALTINAPTAPGVYDLKIELLIGAGAGAVTLAGFSNTDFGEAFTTAAGDFFILQIEKGATRTIAAVRKPT